LYSRLPPITTTTTTTAQQQQQQQQVMVAFIIDERGVGGEANTFPTPTFPLRVHTHTTRPQRYW